MPINQSNVLASSNDQLGCNCTNKDVAGESCIGSEHHNGACTLATVPSKQHSYWPALPSDQQEAELEQAGRTWLRLLPAARVPVPCVGVGPGEVVGGARVVAGGAVLAGCGGCW